MPNYLIKFALLFIFYSHALLAQNLESLLSHRLEAIKQYVTLLGQGNEKSIVHLFTPDAIAVSSSGKKETPTRFYKKLFTKTIKNPEANLINTFSGIQDPDMMTAYFDYAWDNIKNERVSAKFLDLFVFQKNSTKFKAIYVFSNTFQQDIMKQKITPPR